MFNKRCRNFVSDSTWIKNGDPKGKKVPLSVCWPQLGHKKDYQHTVWTNKENVSIHVWDRGKYKENIFQFSKIKLAFWIDSAQKILTDIRQKGSIGKKFLSGHIGHNSCYFSLYMI